MAWIIHAHIHTYTHTDIHTYRHPVKGETKQRCQLAWEHRNTANISTWNTHAAVLFILKPQRTCLLQIWASVGTVTMVHCFPKSSTQKKKVGLWCDKQIYANLSSLGHGMRDIIIYQTQNGSDVCVFITLMCAVVFSNKLQDHTVTEYGSLCFLFYFIPVNMACNASLLGVPFNTDLLTA